MIRNLEQNKENMARIIQSEGIIDTLNLMAEFFEDLVFQRTGNHSNAWKSHARALRNLAKSRMRVSDKNNWFCQEPRRIRGKRNS